MITGGQSGTFGPATTDCNPLTQRGVVTGVSDTQAEPENSGASVPMVMRDVGLRKAKIMAVDDEPINLKVVQQYLRLEGYTNFISGTDSRVVFEQLELEQPDVLLLDLMMPFVSGLDILESLRADRRWASLPVIILTAAADQTTKRRALSLGANEFLGKPIDPAELIPRIRNVLLVKQHFDHLETYSKGLEAEVLRRTAELARSRQEITLCLARACEYRDQEAGRHVARVGRYTRLMAKALGWRGDCLDVLEQAAQLHDIGNIALPDAIVQKPEKVAPEEFAILSKYVAKRQMPIERLSDDELKTLRNHTEIGARLLAATQSPILALAATISLSHHERWDGTGYPLGLAGEDIPIEGRMTAIADTFDMLASPRPYKPSFELEKCFSILEEGRGTAFDPRILDAFFCCRQEILYTQLQYSDSAA
ncbi:MAG TPA: HD domain-containing phosphohydrolase [Pirellulales bacterium]|nr:HD domain-containing phosphohydrolase [Pirellulales bacterium]